MNKEMLAAAGIDISGFLDKFKKRKKLWKSALIHKRRGWKRQEYLLKNRGL